MLKVYRCWICGETYLGEEPPTDCPFCGADKEFLKPGEEYVEPDIELSPRSKENLERALELEVSNASFYFCAYRNADGPRTQGMFKRLAKVESEHAEAICKFLKIDLPKISKDSKECSETVMDNVKEAHGRESRAIDHYRQFAEEAVEPRLKEFFEALVEIESDHLELHQNEM